MRMALNQQQHPLYDNLWPVAMQIRCQSSVASPFSIQGERKQDIIRIVIYCVGRIMGPLRTSLRGTVMARCDTSVHQGLGQGTTSVSQRLPSESLKFTKVWAKVPPKCFKGCPLSHLSSPRFGPRYHLSVSKVAL